MRAIRLVRQASGLLFQAASQKVRHEWLGQTFPSKPTVLQFPINDICNARCVMCNIGYRKRDKEITPADLSRILKDPLFLNVRYVGISGGEPTLRPDIAELGRVLVSELSKLQGVGIITNGYPAKIALSRILSLAKNVQEKKIPFNVCVSLDGIGEVHDQNRGVKGNFDSAVEVIFGLKEAGLSTSIACTLTPVNCYGADDVLLWCRENEIRDWKFRLAVEIKRVYNEGYNEKYPFTPEQRFHLIMFFDKLSNDHDVNELHRIFYKSLVNQLAYGSVRTAGCDWKTRGATLDSRGNISYCSVQSPILGSSLEQSGWDIFRKGISERRKIIQQSCNSCQHDLQGVPPSRLLFQKGVECLSAPLRSRYREISDQVNRKRFSIPGRINPATRSSPKDWEHVLITGWYGSETAGDKAIVGELLEFLAKETRGCKVSLTTLDRKVTEQTKRELESAQNLEIVGMSGACNPSLIEKVDAVIIGGGPLQEIHETENVWRIFSEANRQKKARLIFGCGIGPVFTDKTRQLLASIFRMTTLGFLRDRQSAESAFQLSGVQFEVGSDPAIAYFRRWNRHFKRQNSDARPRLVGLLRANTREYLPALSEAELVAQNDERACQIARVIERFCNTYDGSAELLPMHSITLGGDDRLFARKIAQNFTTIGVGDAERKYLTLTQLLHEIAQAKIALAMRYHSHLICLAFGIPFVSINYTGSSGKVASLIQRIGYGEWCEDWVGFQEDHAWSSLSSLYEERTHWSQLLQQKADDMVRDLESVYTRMIEKPLVS